MKISKELFAGVPSTLFLILWSQYLESKKLQGMVHDSKVIEMVESLDYEFSSMRVNSDHLLGVVVRKEIITEQIKKFIANNPEGVVVNLGCGLDTHCDRFKDSGVLWFDLDLPPVIELRNHFFPQTEKYRLIAKSVMDFSWMDEIPKERKVLFIAEGLLPYFPESEVKQLVTQIDARFKEKELLVQAISRWRFYWMHRATRKVLCKSGWAVSSGVEMDGWTKGISFQKEWYFLARYPKRWRWHVRLFSLIPAVFKADKIIHLAETASGKKGHT